MTRYLLDTHVVHWWLRNDRRLGKAARKLLAEEDCLISVISVWEMLLKNARGKFPLPDGPLGPVFEAEGFRILALQAQHVDRSRGLAASHSDPFDRLLLACALSEGLSLLTADSALLALVADNPLLPIRDVVA